MLLVLELLSAMRLFAPRLCVKLTVSLSLILTPITIIVREATLGLVVLITPVRSNTNSLIGRRVGQAFNHVNGISVKSSRCFSLVIEKFMYFRDFTNITLLFILSFVGFILTRVNFNKITTNLYLKDKFQSASEL